MKPEIVDSLFNEALEIIKRNAQKDPEKAYNWFELLESDLGKYSDFDDWCLKKYNKPANEYLFENGIIRYKNVESDSENILTQENAVVAYHNAIQTLHDMDSHTYTNYIVGAAEINGVIEKESQYHENLIIKAHDYFVELDKHEKDQAEEYTKHRNQVLKDILDGGDFYAVMEGIRDPEISVAVAIAYVLFFETKAEVYLEFLRDHWEYRGDLYKDPVYGGKWLYFYYSSKAPMGEVEWRYKNKPLEYEWKKEKANEKIIIECEQMISQNTYDDVRSLDINNKKLLFLIENDKKIIPHYNNEYKYVAGSMSYLFNYSCSFVGSLETKPDYIIIAQNSIAREDLQSAIIYKKLNPSVIMIELNRFVELLGEVDLKKLDKNKSSIKRSDLPETAFGNSLDKSKGKTLKEAFENTLFVDYEIIKTAKHISIPEEFVIKDKLFVYSSLIHASEDKIKDAGGIIKNSVSGKTDYFVINFSHHSSEPRLCSQVNVLFDKGKGNNLHVITPKILKQLLKKM